MSQKVGSAPGKIILSGEYAVAFGFPGIAIPSRLKTTVEFHEESAARGLRILWKGITPDDKRQDHWEMYLRHIALECDHFTAGEHRGVLLVRNELPLGKGMGSSTSLLIALVRALVGEHAEAEARTLENLMSPRNSGIDFNVIWHAEPLTFRKGQDSEKVSFPLKFLEQAVLFDTGTPNEHTPELVQWIRSREAQLTPALDTIGQCTERLLKGESPFEVLRDHHRAQKQLGVVSASAEELIDTIETRGGSAKVIGAGSRTGGGGIVLALHSDPTELEETISLQYPSMRL